MSALIFKIEQGKQETQGKEQQISQGTLGETITLPETPGSEPPAVDNISKGAPAAEPKPNPAEAVVKVDGPIGRVFTNALNQLLATEGYLTTLPEALGDADEEKDPLAAMTGDKKATNLVQVYCWRTDAVNASDLVQLSNLVTKHTDRPFVVALEAADTIKNAVGVLESMNCFENLKICYSIESGARYVQGLVCPKK